MTALLEQAFSEAAKLAPEEQDTLAAWLLEELHAEQRWQQLFARSSDTLAGLADEALSEYRAGRTRLLDRQS
jgi:hypothetical protein